jgi:HK97 family phage prohead protease
MTAYEQRAGEQAAVTGRTLIGYAAVFNSRTEIGPGIFEEIAPGAFADAVRQDDVRLTVNHDPSQLLARTGSGTLALAQDTRGLRAMAELPETALGRDTRELVARGDLSGMSFRFVTPPAKQTWSMLPDGSELRTLEALRLIDVTVATFPAYPDTAVALRSRPADMEGIAVTIPVRILRAHRLYQLAQETDRPRRTSRPEAGEDA